MCGRRELPGWRGAVGAVCFGNADSAGNLSSGDFFTVGAEAATSRAPCRMPTVPYASEPRESGRWSHASFRSRLIAPIILLSAFDSPLMCCGRCGA